MFAGRVIYHSAEERRRLGDIPDAAPHAGLAQGRTSDAKPALILRAGGQGNVSRGWCARSLTITPPFSAERLVRFGDGVSRTRREARSTGPFMPTLRHGMKGGVQCFPIGRCEGTLGSAPFRRLAELVGFGNTGMRDCATPNSTCLPLATA